LEQCTKKNRTDDDDDGLVWLETLMDLLLGLRISLLLNSVTHTADACDKTVKDLGYLTGIELDTKDAHVCYVQ
jgi:hypothetical protein